MYFVFTLQYVPFCKNVILSYIYIYQQCMCRGNSTTDRTTILYALYSTHSNRYENHHTTGTGYTDMG